MPSAASTNGQPVLTQTSPQAAPLDGTSAVATATATDSPVETPVETAAAVAETPRGRTRRHARRARLYSYALITVALSAAVIALGATNTAKTKVSWIVASTIHTSGT